MRNSHHITALAPARLRWRGFAIGVSCWRGRQTWFFLPCPNEHENPPPDPLLKRGKTYTSIANCDTHRHREVRSDLLFAEAISQVQSRDRFVPRDDGGRMDRATSQEATND